MQVEKKEANHAHQNHCWRKACYLQARYQRTCETNGYSGTDCVVTLGVGLVVRLVLLKDLEECLQCSLFWFVFQAQKGVIFIIQIVFVDATPYSQRRMACCNRKPLQKRVHIRFILNCNRINPNTSFSRACQYQHQRKRKKDSHTKKSQFGQCPQELWNCESDGPMIRKNIYSQRRYNSVQLGLILVDLWQVDLYSGQPMQFTVGYDTPVQSRSSIDAPYRQLTDTKTCN